MKINKDVKKYINHIKNNGDKKRKLCENEITKQFITISIDRLSNIDNDALEYKGEELKIFINNLINLFKISIEHYKKNTQLKNTIVLILRLTTIAEFSITIDILKKIKNYDKTYNQIINELKNKLLNSADEENLSDDDDYDDASSDDDIIDSIFNNDSLYDNVESDIKNYYDNLSYYDKKMQIHNIKDLTNLYKDNKPLIFRILDLPLNLNSKHNILKCYLQLLNSQSGNDHKLRIWFDSLMTIPFGKYKGINLDDSINPKEFFSKLEETMDEAIHGHNEAKRQIIQIMGQNLRNPKAKGNTVGLWGPMGCGKCFALDTLILMYDGTIKKVQDIKVGDIIMGDDSTPRNVLTLGSGKDDMYDIISENGDKYTVNSEHILCLKYYDNIIEITVKDYLKLEKEERKQLKGYRLGVEFNYNKENIIEPYMCTIEPYIYAFNKLYSNEIPDEYKLNNKNIRLQFLAGLIDSIGCTQDNYYELEVNSIDFLNDIKFLCLSLGFKITISNNKIRIYGNMINEIPLLNIEKIDLDLLENSSLEYTIECKYKEFNDYYGFTLDGNNRFLLGDFTVTHNTSLIKEGIAKAMDKPFIFISLGGATDASFLEGHSYTYEGSIFGRIVNGLIDAQCMDPIIYFDELDKISKTYKGEEITNILIHLTDPIQNTHFRDKYFHGIDIDLSRATLIFSYNNPCNVNPILLDRITSIQTKYLLLSQKIYIAKNYLIPNIIKDIGLNEDDIFIDDDLIEFIINNYTCEGGVRKIKSLLYNIIRELNLKSLLDTITFPYIINKLDILEILKNKHEVIIDKIHTKNKIGIINGLYAMSDGSHGGIIPIQVYWIPSSKPLEIKATGNLQQVIKESTEVACTLAFNYLTKKKQYKILNDLSEHCKGLHIHCPSGGTPKDGPSAGTAITVAIYSVLTNNKIKNNIAITGEITLEGTVTEIGGLDNKLEGAKKAGVKLVLFPKGNLKDFKKIKEQNPTLIDKNFKAIPIETIKDAIKYSFI